MCGVCVSNTVYIVKASDYKEILQIIVLKIYRVIDSRKCTDLYLLTKRVREFHSSWIVNRKFT